MYFRQLASNLEKGDYVDKLQEKLDDKMNILGDLSRTLLEEYEDLVGFQILKPRIFDSC